MRYLLDTNTVSEVRKGQRANRGLVTWYYAHDPSLYVLSAVILGEIREGIERMRFRDLSQALALESWLFQVRSTFDGQNLDITAEIADRWGRLSAEHGLPDNDGWIAATAMEYDLTVVTRNVSDFQRSGVQVLNPFT